MNLCGNVKKYDEIATWIQNQLKYVNTKISTNNLLLISGNSGIGKSYSIRHICECIGLYVIYITSSNCSTSAELQDIIVKSASSSLMQLLLNNTQRRIIIIDEFESMMAIDRSMNSALLGIVSNKDLKMIPIICIASNEIIKKIGIMKKKCQHIQLENPTADHIYDMLSLKYTNINSRILKNVSKECNGNISQCIKRIENNNIDWVDDVINIDILYKNFNRNNIRRLILSEQWLTPLRFHENLIMELDNRKACLQKRKQYYKHFMMNFIHFDMMIYNNNDIAIDIFASMIYGLHKMRFKDNYVSNHENFTKLLSYMSLQKKLNKKLYCSSEFPLYQVSTYHTNIIGRNYIFFN